MLDDKEPTKSSLGPLLEGKKDLNMSFTDLKNLKLDALSNTQVIAYGIGHFLNDAVAALWFNFLLFFLVEVEPIIKSRDTKLVGSLVGLVFLIGQVVDGLATPLVGIFSDNNNTRCGKRMPYYYVGMILVAGTFNFMFLPCQFCKIFSDTEFWAFFNYAFFAAVVNIGWAMCQVAHMSLVPSISLSRLRRDMLNNLRGNFTFLANLSVLILAAIFFAIINGPAIKYQVLCYITVGFGFCCSLFFVYFIREKPITSACRKLAKEYKLAYSRLSILSASDTVTYEGSFKISDTSFNENNTNHVTGRQQEETVCHNADEQNSPARKRTMSSGPEKSDFRWYHWFKSLQFWLYGGVYMAARIYTNVSASMLLFYLKYSLKFQSDEDNKSHETETPFSFALVLMLVYLSCSLTTTQLTKLYVLLGRFKIRVIRKFTHHLPISYRKKIFSMAAIISIITGFALLFLPADLNFAIYVIVIALGFAQSVILNTSIAYISEVIGMNGANGAFVYGAYSLFEKIANGLLLWIILESKDLKNSDSDEYLRVCISIVPGVAVVFGWICILLGKAPDYQNKADESGNSDALISVEVGSHTGGAH